MPKESVTKEPISKVTARPLMAKDVFVLARIARASRADIERIAKEARRNAPALQPLEATQNGIAPSYTVELDYWDFGMAVVFALLEQADSEIKPLLADIAQTSVEDFDRVTLTALLDLITQIVEQEDWPAFLDQLSVSLTGRVKVAI
jgi:hypothetical protein